VATDAALIKYRAHLFPVVRGAATGHGGAIKTTGVGRAKTLIQLERNNNRRATAYQRKQEWGKETHRRIPNRDVWQFIATASLVIRRRQG
jgi:hypothetical protein